MIPPRPDRWVDERLIDEPHDPEGRWASITFRRTWWVRVRWGSDTEETRSRLFWGPDALGRALRWSGP